MGINGLWDVINDAAEVVHIADYAARHFEQHKRPLRIAVDEACWRFTNLTPEQVQKIREGEPAANPVEKTILWRALRLMKLNIQLLFVYDGPRKPWKRNSGGGSLLDKELIKLLHQLFDHLRIPYHQAPGEAEAECAKLQQLGIVDAVWSDDGDAFMFGCGTLIKQHKVGKNRVKDYVKVFKAETIKERFDLDADSLILFAMLSGGDYNTTGLQGCGPQTAKLVAQRKHGISAKARYVQHAQLEIFRQALHLTFKMCGKYIEIPVTFPDFKALGHYRDPAISTDEQARNLRGLRKGWETDQNIHQPNLRVLLRDRFHFGTREFLKHIAPVYLARTLARAIPEQRAENMQYGVQLKRTRTTKKDDADDTPAKSEVKVTFSPQPAMQIDLSVPPPEEDWSIWEGKDGAPYDPLASVECEVLDCFLRHGLPEGGVLPAPAPAKRKRKDDGETSISPSSKKQKTSAAESGSQCPSSSRVSPSAERPVKRRKARSSRGAEPCDADAQVTADGAASTAASSAQQPKKRGRRHKDGSAEGQSKKQSKKAEVAAATRLPSPPPAVFRLPKTVPLLPPGLDVVNLAESSDEDELPSFGHEASLKTSESSLFVSPAKPKSQKPFLEPGESIAPEALRELRAASSLLRPPTKVTTTTAVSPTPWSQEFLQRTSNLVPPPEIIDLT